MARIDDTPGGSPVHTGHVPDEPREPRKRRQRTPKAAAPAKPDQTPEPQPDPEPESTPEPEVSREQTTANTEVATMERGLALGSSLNARIRYARELAQSGLLPAAYRRNPANVLYAVEYGTMLGIAPMAAINGIHIIDGKPTVSPALMSALVRTAGHKLRIKMSGAVEAGDLRATVTLIRLDDPDNPFESTWTLQRAERAELVRLDTDEHGRCVPFARDSKGRALPWQKYPEAMVKARAISEVCREGAEEVLCGAHYTPEELGAIVDADGDVIEGEVVETLDASAAAEQQGPQSAPPAIVKAVRQRILDSFRPQEIAERRDAYLAAERMVAPAAAKVTPCEALDGTTTTLYEFIVAAREAHRNGTVFAPAAPVPTDPDGTERPQVTPAQQVKVDAWLDAEREAGREPSLEEIAEAVEFLTSDEAADAPPIPAEIVSDGDVPPPPSADDAELVRRARIVGEIEVLCALLDETPTALLDVGPDVRLDRLDNAALLSRLAPRRPAGVRALESRSASAAKAYGMLGETQVADVKAMLRDVPGLPR